MQRAGKSNCTEQLKESEVTKNHASFRLFCKLKSSTCVLPVAPGLTPRSLPPRQPLPPQLGCESQNQQPPELERAQTETSIPASD